MEKTITFVRHAHAEEIGYQGSDFLRQLRDKGINKSISVGQSLKKQGYIPDLILSSPAFRAIETAIIVAKQLQFTCNHIQFKEIIYQNFTPLECIKLVETLDNSKNHIMIFGHNMDISELTQYFTDGNEEILNKGGYVQIKFTIKSWKEISKGNGIIEIIDN